MPGKLPLNLGGASKGSERRPPRSSPADDDRRPTDSRAVGADAGRIRPDGRLVSKETVSLRSVPHPPPIRGGSAGERHFSAANRPAVRRCGPIDGQPPPTPTRRGSSIEGGHLPRPPSPGRRAYRVSTRTLGEASGTSASWQAVAMFIRTRERIRLRSRTFRIL